MKVYESARPLHDESDGEIDGAPGERWTLEEAAARLDPPMTSEQVRAMVHSAGLQPVGRRRIGFGRFRFVYDARQVREAHAAVAPLLGTWEAGPGVLYDRMV